MAMQVYIGTDLRIASGITFIPGADVNKHHALATAICNRGQSQNGKELRDEISLNFWGKRAINAAHYLYPGKQVNIMGRLQSFVEDTGKTNAAGKKLLNRKIEVVVTRMELLGDSMKEIEKIVAHNLQLMKNAGRMPAEVVITAAELLKSNKPKPVDFNPALAAQTGYFGLQTSKVWTKDRGFWKPGTPVQAPAEAPVNAADAMAKIEELQKQLAALSGGTAPAPEKVMEADGAIDPFAG